MQENLTGFLEKDAKGFMAELWSLLLSAQDEETGIPTKFLEAQMKVFSLVYVSPETWS